MNRLEYNKLSPEASQAMFNLSNVVGKLNIDKKIKELIKIRASQLNGCVFCVDMHVKEARLHGETELRLHHLPIWHESSLFTDTEKAALEWTEALTQFEKHGVSDELYNKMLQYFSEKELSDLSFAVMTINAWNRLGVAFRTTPGIYDKMLGLDKIQLG